MQLLASVCASILIHGGDDGGGSGGGGGGCARGAFERSGGTTINPTERTRPKCIFVCVSRGYS